MLKAKLGDRDLGTEVDVLYCVEELDTIFHGPLECLAAGDEAGAAGALVDDGGGYGFFEVVGTGGSAGVDKAGAAHIAVGDLVAAEVDGMIAGKVGVNALVELAVARIAHVEGFVAAVIFRELLLDDVGFDGDAQMVGLSSEVGGEVVVLVF